MYKITNMSEKIKKIFNMKENENENEKERKRRS